MISIRTSSLLLLLLAPCRETVDTILEESEIPLAPLVTDDEFLRRITLDLAGRVPTIGEIREFRRHPDRAKKIADLLASDEFARSWAESWTVQLNGYVDAFDSNRLGLQVWLEKQIRANRPYDEIVTELVTASGSTAADGPVHFLARHESGAAVKISRSFLGVRIQCAQCHDHPFDRWTQADYQGFARFFDATERDYVSNGIVVIRDDVTKARGTPPRFLTGSKPSTTQWRKELAYFLVRSRPFARTFANRLWYHFFGRGIVDPPDDVTSVNKPSVPALLEHLAGEAARLKFDLRAMIRIIVSSDAYRRKVDDRIRALKPMTPEQIFDSATTALEMKVPRAQRTKWIRRFTGEDVGEDFTNRWEYRERVQDLLSKLSMELTVPKDATAEELFLRILSREPSERERELVRGRDPRSVAFALVNSNEFFFGH